MVASTWGESNLSWLQRVPLCLVIVTVPLVLLKLVLPIFWQLATVSRRSQNLWWLTADRYLLDCIEIRLRSTYARHAHAAWFLLRSFTSPIKRV